VRNIFGQYNRARLATAAWNPGSTDVFDALGDVFILRGVLACIGSNGAEVFDHVG
jgi:hypothetical protein